MYFIGRSFVGLELIIEKFSGKMSATTISLTAVILVNVTAVVLKLYSYI